MNELIQAEQRKTAVAVSDEGTTTTQCVNH